MEKTEQQAGIVLQVNGKEREVPAGTTLLEIVGLLGARADRVVVERNLEIVPAAELGKVVVCTDDRVEVIQFVGGG